MELTWILGGGAVESKGAAEPSAAETVTIGDSRDEGPGETANEVLDLNGSSTFSVVGVLPLE